MASWLNDSCIVDTKHFVSKNLCRAYFNESETVYVGMKPSSATPNVFFSLFRNIDVAECIQLTFQKLDMMLYVLRRRGHSIMTFRR